MAFYNVISDGCSFEIPLSNDPEDEFEIYATSYTRAASVLAEHLLSQPRFASYEALPVVFLYRHAFELILKGFYRKAAAIAFYQDEDIANKPPNFHRLVPLAKFFTEMSRLLYPGDTLVKQINKTVLQYAKEFEQIDPNSFSYRYPINTKGEASARSPQHVNLLSLHESMQKLLDDLDTVHFDMNAEEDWRREAYHIMLESAGYWDY